ncbi:TetR family transcriptional regulator [Nocardia abscessus]|uniref:TetR family transcriptional regulator n=1 Tax=Nocardia abscessus TaxID=120957 RepID=A0ABS0C1I9_9NOCA|nr:TetR family transcriptional regulator [Nocardia abscessus]MBF6224224.1 TetR family transcriptional regulator [Nocardia abscessus]
MRSTSELREAIMTAARDEFARYGLAGARIDRIAHAAHASKERLYAHFGDKAALFREVADRDGAEFFQIVTLEPDDVPEFVGKLYDLARQRPDFLRMITWAHLEGLTLDEPRAAGKPIPAQTLAAIEQAQQRNLVDPVWDPLELLVMLFGIGLSWAQWPDPTALTDNPAVIAHRRASAVEAAARVIRPRTG